MQNQKQTLEKAEATFQKCNARLKELQASYQEGSAVKLLETLTEDVNNMRFQVRPCYLLAVGRPRRRPVVFGR